jgi:hypothetical protein
MVLWLFGIQNKDVLALMPSVPFAGKPKAERRI